MAKSAKPATKSEILSNIAEATELSRKQVASVIESLTCQIKAAVGKKGPGTFALPGLMKIMVIQKPATPKRKGINPFTKQEQIFAVLRTIRDRHPHWPVLIAQTGLNEGYPPGQGHVLPYPYDREGWPSRIPTGLARALTSQRETLGGIGGAETELDPLESVHDTTSWEEKSPLNNDITVL